MSKTVVFHLLVFTMMACGCESATDDKVPLQVPRGFLPILQVERDGQMYRFGPFIGYYFRPREQTDLATVDFVCFNERGFYASDMPVNAQLYRGEAILKILSPQPDMLPAEGGRIRPVFFHEAPHIWRESRPEPQDEFVHFHSLHNAGGPTFMGYWLRHEALKKFTYDMGGRVGSASPLFHYVEPGPDRSFPRIIEFDFGSAATFVPK